MKAYQKQWKSLSKSIWLNWVFFLHIVFILANPAMLNLINPAIHWTSAGWDIVYLLWYISGGAVVQPSTVLPIFHIICLYIKKNHYITPTKRCTNSSWKWDQKKHLPYVTIHLHQIGSHPKGVMITTMLTRWFVSQGSNLPILTTNYSIEI